MVSMPVVDKFLFFFDLYKASYLITIVNILCCGFLVVNTGNELKIHIEDVSRTLGASVRDESDWYALAKVTKIVIYLFNVTANLLMCCGMYMSKEICCSLKYYIMTVILSIVTMTVGIVRLSPLFISYSLISFYFLICIYSLERKIEEKEKEKEEREREFDRDRLKGY